MNTNPRRYVPSALTTAISILVLVGMLVPMALFSLDWKEAVGPRQWSFPQDHGSHPKYRTEWWYFTGNLTDISGHKYGYQLTFFRHGLAIEPKFPGNPWSVRDIYFAHFAITDISGGVFYYADRASRQGPGLAGSKEGSMDVHVLNWSANMKNGTIDVQATHGEMEVALRLAPAKPPVLHGLRGFSKKGPGKGQASYYYSFTNLKTKGRIRVPGMTGAADVSGTSWFDQEFGSNQLTKDQAGWDWFAIHLSDGRDLMIYYLRRKDGAIERDSSGTLVEPDGTHRHLSINDIDMTVLGWWESKKSAGLYPAKWLIKVPGATIDVTITPTVADQELITTGSTAITYWEGAVEGGGVSRDREVAVQGYVELTGYAGVLGGIF